MSAENHESNGPKQQPAPLNLFFRLTAIAGAVFVITILALMALIFSDSPSPVARFLRRSGGFLIAVEVATILVFGILALGVDRREILRETGDNEKQRPPGTTGAAEESQPTASNELPASHEPDGADAADNRSPRRTG